MLILVRHGRTAANASGLLQGRADHPLDEVGWLQVERVAEALAGSRVTRVVTSPLLRARDTAHAVAARHGIAVIEDERFIELDYGTFDGLPIDAVDRDTWRTWRADPEFRPPRGESLADLDARVRPALAQLWETSAREPEAVTVVVSHVSPIKSAVVWALGGGPQMSWRMSLDRASITKVASTANGPALASFNDTSHLPTDLAR